MRGLRNGMQFLARSRRALKRLYFRHVRAGRTPHDILCTRGPFPLRLCSHSPLAQHLFVDSVFEQAESRLMQRIAKPGMRALDVGANIGYYTILLAKGVGSSGHVWSFEPYPPAMAYLKDNVAMNGLSNVTLVEKAVGAIQESLPLHVFSAGNDVYNSLGAIHRKEEDLSAIGTVAVDVVTLDSFLAERNVEAIDILKVDVEGMEERVLQGAEHVLNKNYGISVLAEMYQPSAEQCGCSVARAIEMMTRWGFKMYEILPNGDLRLAAGSAPASYNLFFTRQ